MQMRTDSAVSVLGVVGRVLASLLHLLTNKTIASHRCLTSDFENEATMPPTRAERDRVPMATFRTHVGKSSGEKR